MIDLAKHIIANAVMYIDDYSKRDNLNDYEKGILNGLWICIDSIRNHLEMEELEIDIDIDKILYELDKLSR